MPSSVWGLLVDLETTLGEQGRPPRDRLTEAQRIVDRLKGRLHADALQADLLSALAAGRSTRRA